MSVANDLDTLPGFLQETSLNAGCRIVLDQFKRRDPVHAYLFSGARGLGKATFAKALACTLFCDEPKKPCGECDACRQVLHDANPDVLRMIPDGEKRIGVERVREVIEKISQHAFGAGFRIVMIWPVEMLTAQAQNCLLKSLEEPVSNVVFLLTTNEMTAVLGTIASRCACVKMTPWPDETMRAELRNKGYPDKSVAKILPICSGNIGLAVSMLEEQDQEGEFRNWAEKALSVSCDADVVRLSTKIKDDRGEADRYLVAIEQALHQALLIKTERLTTAALEMVTKPWKETVMNASAESMLQLLHEVTQARRYKASQVNWQSTADQLLMKILGETIKWRQ